MNAPAEDRYVDLDGVVTPDPPINCGLDGEQLLTTARVTAALMWRRLRQPRLSRLDRELIALIRAEGKNR